MSCAITIYIDSATKADKKAVEKAFGYLPEDGDGEYQDAITEIDDKIWELEDKKKRVPKYLITAQRILNEYENEVYEASVKTGFVEVKW